MPRILSCAATIEAVKDESKTVSRRLGWFHACAGDQLYLAPRCMGFKKGEHVERIKLVRLVSTHVERLDRLVTEPDYGAREMVLEGFPGMDPGEFVAMFVKLNHLDRLTYSPGSQVVNRLEWVYLPWPVPGGPHA